MFLLQNFNASEWIRVYRRNKWASRRCITGNARYALQQRRRCSPAKADDHWRSDFPRLVRSRSFQKKSLNGQEAPAGRGLSGHEAKSSLSRPPMCITGHEGPMTKLFDLSNKSPRRMRIYLGIPRAILRFHQSVSTSGLAAVRGDQGMVEPNAANPRGGSGGNQNAPSIPLRQS
jgi:hypothetical protein